LTKERFQHWIESFDRVLKQERDTLLDAVFNRSGLGLGILGWLDGSDLGILVHVLDPVIALHLRIDHERPSLRVVLDNCVLYGEGFLRKFLDEPVLDLYFTLNDVS
jgi:hypothetical protein